MALLSRLDPWLYRYPFEGASARRYARLERCGFGDLDERLIRRWDRELARAERVLDVGCGPGTLATRIARRYPRLEVIAVEPSRDYTARGLPDVRLLRARAEALPLADASADLAVCLSSIRHVRDRAVALGELRRVVRPGGAVYIVELDPAAEKARAREHTRRMRSRWSRLTFAPLVMRTAPCALAVEALARQAGFAEITTRPDPFQPVYIMRLA